MSNRKFLNVLTSLIVIVSLLSGGITQVNAQGAQKAASMPAQVGS